MVYEIVEEADLRNMGSVKVKKYICLFTVFHPVKYANKCAKCVSQYSSQKLFDVNNVVAAGALV